MPNKKFIDKKNAVTFRLVHRSQRDPLIADGPQHVLVEQAPRSHHDQPTSSVPNQKTDGGATEQRKQEQFKYGIEFDDDYDYLQHLKEVKNVNLYSLLPNADNDLPSGSRGENRLVLPSSAFASNVEESIGLLNRAAPNRDPRFDWDEDVLETLDDAFDENDREELDDDFVIAANRPGSKEDLHEDCYMSTDGEGSNEGTEIGSSDTYDEFELEKDETKSRFTEYSMSSAVVNRNKGLTLVDDQFETFYECYDDDLVGDLYDDESTGNLVPGNLVLERAIEEFQEDLKKLDLNDVNESVKVNVYDSSTEEEDVELVEEDLSARWDCESILSTYSTYCNHPKVIDDAPPRKLKLAMPTRQLDELENGDHSSNQNVVYRRPSNETPEERKQRKKAVKVQRRKRREKKKENTKLYKDDDKRQKNALISAKQNIQGIKLA